MFISPFNPREEKNALAAALSRFHEQWEQRTSIQVFLNLCDAAERAPELVAALTLNAEQHDMETRLQFIQMRILLHSALRTVEHVQDEPVAAPGMRYSTSEAQLVETPTSILPTRTIVSCPECSNELYKVTREASTVGIVVDDGSLLAPMN